MTSLQGRLTTALATVLILVFVIQWSLVSVAITRVTENYVADRLQHEIENLIVALSFDDKGQPRLDHSRTGPVFRRAYSGHYFRIQAETGAPIRSRSLWDYTLDGPELEPGDSKRLHITGPQHQPLLVLVRGYRKQGMNFTIAVAEDLSTVEQDIQRFQLSYALVSVFFLLLLVILQRFSVQKSLQPLEAVRTDVANLKEGKATSLHEETPVEIKPLVDEINHLIQVTVQRLNRSRNAVGNLAHALKTPLTVLTQTARDPSLADKPAVRQTIEDQTSTMRQYIDRELKRARLAGEGPSGTHFDVSREIPSLVTALQRMYSVKALDIQTEIPHDRTYPGDREDMLELLGNLMDNACKWARARVRLTVYDESGLHLIVEDDGPGIQSGGTDSPFARGTRLDESTEGYGLGLSIVRDIVEQYEGTIEFRGSDALGGLAVEVSLPGAAAVL